MLSTRLVLFMPVKLVGSTHSDVKRQCFKIQLTGEAPVTTQRMQLHNPVWKQLMPCTCHEPDTSLVECASDA